MLHAWYVLSQSCQRCGTDMTLVRAAYSSNEQFRFDFVCEKCAFAFSLLPFASQLAEMARDADTEKDKKAAVQITRNPVRPPVVEPTRPDMTESDKKFLKDLGIKEDEDEKH